MEIRALLMDAFERIRGDVRRVMHGLDAGGSVYRPDPDANSIAWLVWHATRIQDDHVAELAGRDQAWIDDGWADALALPFPPSDTGFGHSSEQVAAVRPEAPQLLVDYHEAVFLRTQAYLESLDAAQLDRIVDDRYDPPVSAGVRIVSVIHDGMQHLGQAAYVRGVYERERR